MIVTFSIPTDPSMLGEWLRDPVLSYRIIIALNMVPLCRNRVPVVYWRGKRPDWSARR